MRIAWTFAIASGLCALLSPLHVMASSKPVDTNGGFPGLDSVIRDFMADSGQDKHVRSLLTVGEVIDTFQSAQSTFLGEVSSWIQGLSLLQPHLPHDRSKSEVFVTQLSALANDFAETVCSNPKKSGGGIVPASCNGGEFIFQIDGGACEMVEDVLICQQPSVFVTQTPANCNLKYKAPTTICGKKCGIVKTHGKTKIKSIKKPAVLLTLEKETAFNKTFVVDKTGFFDSAVNFFETPLNIWNEIRDRVSGAAAAQ